MSGRGEHRIGRRALLAAATGAGIALAGPQASTAASGRDVALLRDAVRLERDLALAFGTATHLLSTFRRPLEREFLGFAAHARDRADTFTASLRLRGGHPAAPRARGPTPSPRQLLALEEQAVAFYERALGELHDTHLILFMGSALAGHAQELVVMREAVGGQPLARAFETGRPGPTAH